MASIELLEAESRHLMSDLGATREQLSVHRLDETSFQKDKGMVPFYTGLPSFALLLGLFQLLQGSVRHSERNSLSKFQEMIVFLVRLRLNLPLQDLAYRFQVSQSTITRIVDKWLDAAYLKLPKAVKWPGRDVLRKSMPMAFRRTFGTRVAVILDCFEVFIDRPSSLHARALTWSSYKHHNTVKYLIGIAPQGKITFISKGWGGRTSDKHLTEQCGVLDNLLPGDSVLADRGFTISDAVSVHCAGLEIPAFTRGKAQLAPCAIEATRNLANVRIHVERVIGLVRRKYRILKSTIPVELLVVRSGNATGLDKIVAVCAALTNMSPSVVPFG
ncbi:conserved hypothetical protein [Ixodes scapularis]|uniref:Tick transposon n=1 Tax=Ixodes scapularis TaxID=6945 RepID=B7QHF7_IXOSC|nr:conserved hypothetical protein [Ixodes scapularis]|eukprot:XP_002414614.1 conserved hypothetical protein [Ixodes scapularis]